MAYGNYEKGWTQLKWMILKTLYYEYVAMPFEVYSYYEYGAFIHKLLGRRVVGDFAKQLWDYLKTGY